MRRREFFQKAGIGSAGLVALPVLGDGLTTSAQAQDSEHKGQNEHRPEEVVSGSLASATVSFGAWRSDLNPSVDRYPNGAVAAWNAHYMLPFETTIEIGGSVNFIISGLHQVIVYGPGTRPERINTSLTRPTTGVPAGVPLINDPTNRVYAGPDPSIFGAPLPPYGAPVPLRDRSEAVHFANRGLHLVICGVLDHFLAGMIGYVRVVR